ncbi:hypothetical protein ACFX15_017963 [Malus domestica]
MRCKQPRFSSKRGAQARKGGISLPERRNPKKEDNDVIARLAQSQIIVWGKQAVNDVASIMKKLMKSTGKAVWIADTSFLILVANILSVALPQKQVESGWVESETYDFGKLNMEDHILKVSVEDKGLLEYFFGKDGKRSLKLERIVQFFCDLHEEVCDLHPGQRTYR